MKKIIIGSLIVITLFIGSLYLFIPSTIVISNKISVSANQRAVLRKLINETEWKQWWPGNQTGQNSNILFNYKNKQYQIVKKLYSGFVLYISNNSSSYYSLMNFIPENTDSVKIDWSSVVYTSINPIKRVQQYLMSKQLSDNNNIILSHLKPFLENMVNLYGIQITETNVKDTTLVFTKVTTQNYPSTKMIYSLIEKLKNYIIISKAHDTNFPMLHININGSSHFETMVAIPVDKQLQGKEKIVIKRMVAGKILVAEVKGGPASIKTAFSQIENYMADHHRLAPAIPFESLVTNRILVTDTSQWITNAYYPVY
jgi:hypothetical protein